MLCSLFNCGLVICRGTGVLPKNFHCFLSISILQDIIPIPIKFYLKKRNFIFKTDAASQKGNLSLGAHLQDTQYFVHSASSAVQVFQTDGKTDFMRMPADSMCPICQNLCFIRSFPSILILRTLRSADNIFFPSSGKDISSFKNIQIYGPLFIKF